MLQDMAALDFDEMMSNVAAAAGNPQWLPFGTAARPAAHNGRRFLHMAMPAIPPILLDWIVLKIDKPESASRTLTLRGTAQRNYTWEVDSSSVPSWLVLDKMNGTFTGEVEAPITTMTAFTTGVAERAEPYEARLLLHTFAALNIDYAVPVCECSEHEWVPLLTLATKCMSIRTRTLYSALITPRCCVQCI